MKSSVIQNLCRLAALLILAHAAAASATTYYISSLHGSNANDGLSAATPWADFTTANATTFQPGDRILLERGSVWNGTILSPYGSGSATAPIVVDTYGPSAARPIINGGGFQSTLHGASSAVVNDPTNYPGYRYGSGTVTLFNQQYWEINNLELTNKLSGAFDPTNKANNFSGIRVWARGAGALAHIYIRGNYVHDVTGEVSWSGDRAESKRTGGIVIYTWDYNSESTRTTFDDIRIENNFVSNVSMEGIGVQQASKTNLYSIRSSFGDTTSYNPYTNLIIDGNVINNQNNNNSSDAIQFVGVRYAHVYNNLVLGGGTVGIETDFSDQAVIEMNEVAGVKQHWINQGGIDHAGIDIDRQSSNITAQYNYSHDNGEGLIVDAYDFGYNNLIRFNLLANNDVGSEGSHSNTPDNSIPGDQMRLSSESGDTYVSNNTIYDKNQTLPIVGWNQPQSSSHTASYYLTNNVFDGGIAAWPGGTLILPHYSYNSYYRNGTAPSADAHAVTSDPLLLNPGGTDYGTTPGAFPASVYGYRLQFSSPAKSAGTTPGLPPGAPVATKDFFRNNIGSPSNIGFDTSGGGIPGHITIPIAAWLWNTNSNSPSSPDGNGNYWILDSTYSGATGVQAEAALPDNGSNDSPAAGPVLGYRVLFLGANTYSTWVRGVAPYSSADSMHIGLDGSYPATGTNVYFSAPSSDYQWTGQYYNTSNSAPAPAAIAVPSAGAHYVDLEMREDGLRVDETILTSDPNYVPVIWAGNFNPATSTVGSAADSTGHTWTPDTTYAGFYNTGAMLGGSAATDVSGTPATNAVLHYTVNFPAAGTWYVWVHGYSAGSATGFVAAAVDSGSPQPMQLPATGSYVWANGSAASSGATPVTVSVGSAGTHDLTLYLTQAGVRVDKIFLTADGNSYPRSN